MFYSEGQCDLCSVLLPFLCLYIFGDLLVGTAVLGLQGCICSWGEAYGKFVSVHVALGQSVNRMVHPQKEKETGVHCMYLIETLNNLLFFLQSLFAENSLLYESHHLTGSLSLCPVLVGGLHYCIGVVVDVYSCFLETCVRYCRGGPCLHFVVHVHVRFQLAWVAVCVL